MPRSGRSGRRSLPTGRTPGRALVALLVANTVASCALPDAASRSPQAAPPGVRLWLFGEQHDQPDQQRQVAEEVRRRAEAGTLAAVVLEMAERGHDTRGVAPTAGEAEVRDALAWSGWPWDAYAAVVMNAVRAGVPVVGANLPRRELREAMRDATLDAQVSPEVRERLAREVRDGHCGLLPPAQVPGMVRVQIARDRSIAQTSSEVLAPAAPGREVLLLTGAQHASRDRGVPLHLDAGLTMRIVMFGTPVADLVADEWRSAVVTPRPDPCESLRRQLGATPR